MNNLTKVLKLFKMLEQFELSFTYGLKCVKINKDLSIDVIDGNVNLSRLKLTKIPFRFRKITHGYFDCSYNNLTSLEGCPEHINGYFNCSNNQLTTLEYCPKVVNGSFNCGYNKITSLIGSPKEILYSFNCRCNNLTSLKGCPEYVADYFDCKQNPKIKSLDGIKMVNGIIYSDFYTGYLKYYKGEL